MYKSFKKIYILYKIKPALLIFYLYRCNMQKLMEHELILKFCDILGFAIGHWVGKYSQSIAWNLEKRFTTCFLIILGQNLQTQCTRIFTNTHTFNVRLNVFHKLNDRFHLYICVFMYKYNAFFLLCLQIRKFFLRSIHLCKIYCFFQGTSPAPLYIPAAKALSSKLSEGTFSFHHIINITFRIFCDKQGPSSQVVELPKSGQKDLD